MTDDTIPNKLAIITSFLNGIAPISAGVIVWYVSTVVSPITSDVREIKQHFFEINTSVATLSADTANLSYRLSSLEKAWSDGSPEILVLRSEINGLKENVSELRKLNYKLSRNIEKLDGEPHNE